MLRVILVVFALLVPQTEQELGPDAERIPTQAAEFLESSIVAIAHEKPAVEYILGTGSFIDPKGRIATAGHLLTDEKGDSRRNLYALVRDYPEATWHELTVVSNLWSNGTGRDIAFLQIDLGESSRTFSYIPIGAPAKIGDPVLAGGFPKSFGGRIHPWPFLRRGIVSSTSYSLHGSPLLILDLPGLQGFSGSPVVALNPTRVVAILKGHPGDRPESDFTVAFTLNERDATK